MLIAPVLSKHATKDLMTYLLCVHKMTRTKYTKLDDELKHAQAKKLVFETKQTPTIKKDNPNISRKFLHATRTQKSPKLPSISNGHLFISSNRDRGEKVKKM